MRLFLKFFTPIALTLIIALSFISLYFILLTNQATVGLSNERLLRDIATVEINLTTFIDDHFVLTKALAKDDAIEDFLSVYDLEDQASVDSIFSKIEDFKESSPYINNILLVPESGDLRIDAKHIRWTKPIDVSEGALFSAYKANPNLSSYVVPPKIAPSNGKPIFELSLRVQKNDLNVGYVIMPINVEYLMENLIYNYLEEKDIHIIITDSEGRIYGSANESFIYNEDYYIPNLDSELFNMITSSQSGTTEQVFFGVPSTITYHYFQPLNSYIIGVKDNTERANTQSTNILRSVLITLALILLFGIIMLLFTRRLVTPIKRMAIHARQVTQGNYDSQLDEKSLSRNDEIGVLANTFQHMTTAINNAFNELNEAQESLSNRLDEVTQKKSQIEYLVNYDTLTTLPNRHSINSYFTHLLDSGAEGVFILLDLDNFKSVNDTLGHKFGDRVLQSVATSLQELVNEHIYIGRMGGDEFVVIVKAQSDVIEVLNAIRNKFNDPIYIDQSTIEITFSMGLAKFPEDSQNPDDMLAYAELALYAVKVSGKNDYAFFDMSMVDNLRYQHQIELSLKAAIDHDGFILYYQPQVSMLTGEIVAYEALIRLKSMAFNPGEFIPVAESTGQIIAIGRWVTREVVRQLGQWQKAGHPIKPVSINFSAYQLYDKDYLQLLTDALKENDLPPSMLEVEITESIYFDNVSMTSQFLSALKDAGVKISIDDYGKGYSSINYLTYMPISKLKMDSSLCKKFLNKEHINVIRSIISLAHSLDLVVVAEGIEDYDSIVNLKESNCDIIQGYYFCKPLPPEEVPENLNKIYDPHL